MAKRKKIDGVVEAVRYSPNGDVDWVRAYLRRGDTFSDRVLIKRQDLIERLKDGKVFWGGERIPYKASTFDTTVQIKVVERNGVEILTTGSVTQEKDTLDGVPVV